MDQQKRLDFLDGVKKKIDEVSDDAAKKLSATKSVKLTAKARLSLLFDEGTFVETGAWVKKRETGLPGDFGDYEGIVTGYGAVDGRLVFAFSQDFARKSGALSEAGIKKILAVYSQAEKNGAPVVSVFDSAGADVTEGIDALAGYASVFTKASTLSGVIPQYAVVAGTAAGFASALAEIADFVFIEKTNGKIFVGSPFVIKNKDANAGSETYNAEYAVKSGLAAKIADGEDKLFAEVRTLIGYLPSNNLDEGVYIDADDDLNRKTDEIASLISGGKYDIKKVIAAVADNGKFYEVYEGYDVNIITGFIAVGHETVGVVATNPADGEGKVCPGALDQAARFVNVLDSFNIPVMTLVDSEGVIVSASAEKAQFPLYLAKLSAAYANATVPKITLNIGKAYGAAYAALGSKGLGADTVFAYPTAQISILAPDTAVELLYGDVILKDKDPAAKRAELISKWEVEDSSPTEAAASGAIDAIIEPAQTRQMIASSLLYLQSKRELRPAKKQNRFPL
ncbi:propionyl-CoA carboxylase subunit beta [Clostridia bacterium]|nr:propionyl-CoA carboxylase subunit beta [Clostridia bacterium]